MSRVFVSPLATPFHSLVSIFPIPSRYISIFRAPPPRYFSPSLTLYRVKGAGRAGYAMAADDERETAPALPWPTALAPERIS